VCDPLFIFIEKAPRLQSDVLAKYYISSSPVTFNLKAFDCVKSTQIASFGL